MCPEHSVLLYIFKSLPLCDKKALTEALKSGTPVALSPAALRLLAAYLCPTPAVFDSSFSVVASRE